MAAKQDRQRSAQPSRALPRQPATRDQALIVADVDARIAEQEHALLQDLAAIDQRHAALRARRKLVETMLTDLDATLTRGLAKRAELEERTGQMAEQERLLLEQRRIVECQLEAVWAAATEVALDRARLAPPLDGRRRSV